MGYSTVAIDINTAKNKIWSSKWKCGEASNINFLTGKAFIRRAISAEERDTDGAIFLKFPDKDWALIEFIT